MPPPKIRAADTVLSPKMMMHTPPTKARTIAAAALVAAVLSAPSTASAQETADPPTVVDGTAAFTGWGVDNAPLADADLAFTGWGGDNGPVASTALTFTGWGVDSGPAAGANLAFTGWGIGSHPAATADLVFAGWGGGGHPAATARVAFAGWGDAAVTGGPYAVTFEGWGEDIATRLTGGLTFTGLDPLPNPCAPEDLLLGKPVLQPEHNPGNGHRYLRFTCQTDWDTARVQCESVGAHLLTITAAAEGDYVADLARACPGAGCWIGATDVQREGTFAWITGEPWSYERWTPGEPNNDCDGEHFVHVYVDGRWNDQAVDGGCNDWGPMQYICEWSDAP